MEHRGFDFEETLADQFAADGRDDTAAAAKRLARFLAHDQVEITLAIAQFDIGKAVIFFRQRQQRLGKDGHLTGVDRQLAARGAADDALDTDQVAEIEQLHQRDLFGRQEIFVVENLDFTGRVMEVDEHAAVAVGADTAGHGDLILGHRPDRQIGIARFQIFRLGAALEAIGIGIDPHRPDCLQFLDPRRAEQIVVFAFVSHQTPSL